MPTTVKKKKGVYVHTWKPEPGRPAHAELAPSDSGRWLVCPGAVNFTKKLRKKLLIPPDRAGRPAAQGTLGHWINEQPEKPEEYLGQSHNVEGYVFKVDYEMVNGSNLWHKNIEETKIVEDIHEDLTEQWVDLSHYGIEGLDGGTVDRLLYNKRDRRAHIIDYKYGFGYVNERTTPQLRIYASGCLELYPKAKEFVLSIVQPRVSHAEAVREFVISRKDLQKWTDNTMLPGAAASADKKNKRLVMSESACKYCANRTFCPAKKQLLDLVQTPQELLTVKESIHIFQNRKLIAGTLKDVERRLWDETQNRDGLAAKKLKFVRKNTNRTVDEKAAAEAFDEDAYTNKLKTVAEIEALCKARKINVHDVIVKPEGDAELVTVDDSRQPLAKGEMF